MKRIHLRCTAALVAAMLLFGGCSVGIPLPSERLSEPHNLTEVVPGGEEAGIVSDDAQPAGLISPVTVMGGSLSDLDLSIPQTFGITRPNPAETLKLSAAASHYFITGTSNPDEPLWLDIEESEEDEEDGDEEQEEETGEIERLGTKGTWGVRVALEEGENEFTFRQGDEEMTVTILCEDAPLATTTVIRQSSMAPAIQYGVAAGESLPLSCVAPAGGTVVARFGGREVILQQVASADEGGIPAVYRGELLVAGDYPAGETTRVGPVSYELTFDEETTTYESSGDVFVVGVNSRLAVEITSYMGYVYPSTYDLSDFKEKLKTGARDYVESQTESYFELASGGYLPKEQATIVEGEVSIDNRLAEATTTITVARETYAFIGTAAPAYVTWLEGDSFFITLYNTVGRPEVDVSASRLFSAVDATAEDDAVTYAFSIRDPALFWGYNVSLRGDKLLLQFQYKPALNRSESRPLQGITVMLDPGHGGADTGAQGVAAGVGPNEALVNLAHAYATRDALMELGATVLLTHDGETTELDERLAAFEASGAQLFLSLHHNSVAESADANKATGIEVYYHTGVSADSAETMLRALAGATGREDRFVEESYYRVTLLAQSPSLLLELGFVSHPLEYEQSTDIATILQVADGIALGVVDIFR